MCFILFRKQKNIFFRAKEKGGNENKEARRGGTSSVEQTTRLSFRVSMGRLTTQWSVTAMLACVLTLALGFALHVAADSGFECADKVEPNGTFIVGLAHNWSDPTSAQVLKGLQAYIDVQESKCPPGFKIGDQVFRMELKKVDVDPGATAAQRTAVIQGLLSRGKMGLDRGVDFLVGGEEGRVEVDAPIANAAKKVYLFSGELSESFYRERNYEYFYGMTGGHNGYGQQVMQMLNIANITKVNVVFDQDKRQEKEKCFSIFDSLTALRVGGIKTKLTPKSSSDLDNANEIDEIVKDIQETERDMIFACVDSHVAAMFAKSFNKHKYPMKAQFYSNGPQSTDFITSLSTTAASYTLTNVPWHKTAVFPDEGFFNTTKDFVRLYTSKFREEPTQYSAAAASSLFVLQKAIESSFGSCDISEAEGSAHALLYQDLARCRSRRQLNGYDRVLFNLEFADMDTVFGRVSFDKWRQNTANQDLLMQVLDVDGNLAPYVVRPVDFADPIISSKLKFPAPNPYKPKKCPAGQFHTNDEFHPCKPCPPGEFSKRPGSRVCLPCWRTTYNPDWGQKKCHRCPEKTQTLSKGAKSITKCRCKDDFYLIDPVNITCEPCPKGAKCNGGTSAPFPKFGYWTIENFRDENNKTAFFPCDPPDVCNGGADFSQICKEGHNGRLCSQCADGFFKVGDSCSKCWDTFPTILVMLLVFGIWYLINLIVSRRVDTLELILNWAQLANVIGSLPLNWEPMIEKVFNAASLLDFDVDIVEPACLMKWSFFHNFSVQMLLPAIMSSMVLLWYCLCWSSFHSIRRWNGKTVFWHLQWVIYVEDIDDLIAQWDKTIAAVLSSIEVTYITITRYAFNVTQCEDIAGASVLRADPSILCSSREYKVLKVFGAIGMIVYTFGYLGFVIYKLTMLWANGAFARVSNIRRYGFLFGRFELDYFWTEVISLVVRIIYVAISVFIEDPLSKAAFLAVVTIIWLLAHVYTAPYVEASLDVLQSFLLVSLVALAFGGVMFFNTHFDTGKRKILEISILMVLSVMWVAFLFIFIMEVVNKARVLIIKRKHCNAVAKSLGQKCEPLNWFHPVRAPINTELYSTFDAKFIYLWLRNANTDMLLDWEELSDRLADFMSDDSFTSYLSLELVAEFWRKLVDGFPELIDFLTIADEGTRMHFNHFAESLYKDFFLKKRIDNHSLYSHINWKDRGPLAQWLALASVEDRAFFADLMAEAFKQAHGERASEWLKSKLKSRGKSLPVEALSRERSLARSMSRSLSQVIPAFSSFTGGRVQQEIDQDRGPFSHFGKSKVRTYKSIEMARRGLSLSRQSTFNKYQLQDFQAPEIVQKHETQKSVPFEETAIEANGITEATNTINTRGWPVDRQLSFGTDESGEISTIRSDRALARLDPSKHRMLSGASVASTVTSEGSDACLLRCAEPLLSGDSEKENERMRKQESRDMRRMWSLENRRSEAGEVGGPQNYLSKLGKSLSRKRWTKVSNIEDEAVDEDPNFRDVEKNADNERF